MNPKPTNCDIYILKILWHNNYEEGVSVHWVCLVKQIKCDEENVATDCISQHEPPDNTSVMDYIPCQLLGIPVHILLTITFTVAFWSLHLDMHTVITFYLSDHFILTCTQLSLSLSIFLITSSWHAQLSLSLFLITSSWHAHSYHFHSIFLITSSWHAHSYHFHSLSFWSLHLDMHTVITFTLYLSDHFILTCTQLSLSLSIFLITSSWHAHSYHFHSLSFWSLHLDMHTVITFTLYFSDHFILTCTQLSLSLSFWSLHLDMHNFFSWATKHQFCKSVETPSKKVNFS